MSVFSNIWQKIKTLFSFNDADDLGLDYTESSKYNSRSMRRSTKKFEIKSERKIPKPGEKFNIINSSRPRSCPRCNSTGTIIKHKTKKWKCDIQRGGCGYIW